MMLKFKKTVMLTIALLQLCVTFAAADEGAGFVRMLQSSNVFVRIEAAKLIEGHFLVDPAVFPVVRERLRQSVQDETYSKEQRDEIGWLCKALASSGDAAYATTLQDIAAASKVKKIRLYAEQSLATIPDFAVRNVRLLEIPGDPTLSFEDNRLLRMLRSGDPALLRNAAKRISRRVETPAVLYQAVAAALEANLNNRGRELLRLDSTGWLCKALGASGETAYVAVLQRVFDNAPTKKLRQHARNALRSLGEV
ncbi:MAG: hypothetical protein K0A93_03780 [Desulfuromonadaceae bacterium]|nr:hypothetical protein [Desulfuromonadaceae bacterium]